MKQLKPMQIFYAMALSLIVLSCNNKIRFSSSEFEIDKLAFSETIYEVELDAEGNIVDTISLEKIKRDKSNNLRFKAKENYYHDDRVIQIENYYDANDEIFAYRILDSEGEFNTRYKTFRNKENIVVSAIQIEEPIKNRKDTIEMIYDYKYYNNGNRKEREIRTITKEKGEKIIKTKYNNNGNEINEMVIQNGDTLGVENWYYEESSLAKSTRIEYLGGLQMKKIFYYDKDKNCVKIEDFYFEYGMFIKALETKIRYNKKAEMINKEEFDIETKKTKRIEFIRSKI